MVMTFALAERRGDEEAGLRRRGRAGVDRVDRPVGHRLADRQTAVGLEVTHRVLRAELLEVAVDGGDVAAERRRQVGIGHRSRSPRVFADLRIELAADGQHDVRHHLADDLGRAPLVRRVEHRPQERHRHRLDALRRERTRRRRGHPPRGAPCAPCRPRSPARARRLPQVARHQHHRGRIGRDRIGSPPPCGRVRISMESSWPAVQISPTLAPLCWISALSPTVVPLMQRSQPATISAGAAPISLRQQPEAVLDRAGRVGGRRQRLEQPHVAAVVGQHEIGEGAAGIDTETILGPHCASEGSLWSDSFGGHGQRARSRAVSAASTSNVARSLKTTP